MYQEQKMLLSLYLFFVEKYQS